MHELSTCAILPSGAKNLFVFVLTFHLAGQQVIRAAPASVSTVQWLPAFSVGRPLVVAGLGNRSAQTFFISRLPNLTERVVLWLTHDEREATAIEELLRFWLPDGPRVHRFAPNVSTELLFQLTERAPLVLICSVNLLETPLPRPEEFHRTILRLRPDEATNPLTLTRHLHQMGYANEKSADASGSYARRGGILDVFPIGAGNAFRLEFADDRIERILRLPKTPRGKNVPVDHLTIPPARLPQGAFGNLDGYLLPVPNLLVVSHDPEESFDEEERLAATLRRFRDHEQVIIQSFRTGTDGESTALDIRSAPLFHHDFDSLANELKIRQKEGWTILAYSERFDELVERLRRKRITVHGSPASSKALEGFESREWKIVCLTDREIFGRQERQLTAPRERLDLGFLLELKAGDYIVHLDHGVGKFLGMTENVVDGFSREYFVLEYAEGDRLSVPVENAEKLSKYIGVAHPKLHRLSGSSWIQATRRVKDEAKVLARDLLTLYAKRETTKVAPLARDEAAESAIRASFPYEETEDQAEAIADVVANLDQAKPMDRLVCGDVGFGKTEVAIRAALQAVVNGKQVAILSPTTILTQQHEDTFRERLKDFPARIASLSRFESADEQADVLAGIKSKQIDVVIGTHRLLSPDVTFKDLGLIIIDEEQRFGVKHKEQLKRLRTDAHVLTLTATPIPRTLNLALSGLRDISLIETPPEGRLPIETIIEPYADDLVRRAIAFELQRNGQVYYLHNEVETIGIAARRLQEFFPKATIGIAHGQLPEDDLARVMAAFDAAETDILVCSTIIENGLDLPNVNTLIVDNATKFGLASLYQLRGRIGRGARQAYAYFLYYRKLLTGEAKKRLQALLEARDLGSGFQLALRDLEIRGVGNILGKEQHGKIAAVGFALYTRLLAQAVEELKTGKPTKAVRDILIDLPLDIGIPRTYAAEEAKRLRLYQELANISRRAELHRKKGEVEKQYGKLPESTRNLFDLLELKLLAQDTQIVGIKAVQLDSRERIILTFSPTIDPKRLPALLTRNENWTFTQDAIKIERQFLGGRWVNELKETVKVFRNGSPAAA